ncbi:hypothetical protein MuYL_3517 [Mucilaginibacter xinganensis]|uniref:Uncharacterized protein n=1 Tax=Mucilaginibacter xinganensis TaxID=1234841 RepID=A0A223NZW4_9SPHI|nr:hypothetical protein MuYL_3517 [Mucilaginibacter xinganensis]
MAKQLNNSKHRVSLFIIEFILQLSKLFKYFSFSDKVIFYIKITNTSPFKKINSILFFLITN